MSVWRAFMLATDEVTGVWWGEGRMDGKSAGLYYFRMKESARRSFEPVHEGRTEQTLCQAAARPSAAEAWAAFLLLPQCNLERWTHALTRLSRDLSRQHSGWSFLFSPMLQDICTSDPWGFPGMLKRPPKVGLSSYSSAPIPSAAFFFFFNIQI